MNHPRGITTIHRPTGIAEIRSRGRTVLPHLARTQRHGLIPLPAVAIRLLRVLTPRRATAPAEAVVAGAVEGAARTVAVAAVVPIAVAVVAVVPIAAVVVLMVVEDPAARTDFFGHSQARFGVPQRAFPFCPVL